MFINGLEGPKYFGNVGSKLQCEYLLKASLYGSSLFFELQRKNTTK